MGRAVVRHVTRMDCAPFIVGIHYAKRWPSVSFMFGLFLDDALEGVVTYGTPSSSPLRSGICGNEYSSSVIELNRLCLRRNIKNNASFLISKSLRMIGGNRIIVSFADISEGHNGAVYRASNFLYCGLSEKRTDWKIRGMEHLHGQTVADEFRGSERRVDLMRKKYGEDFYLAPRPRKHRYIKIIGTKGFRARAMRALRYDVVKFGDVQ